MELTETEKYLISGLKLQKVSKGKLAAICLMLETEKQLMQVVPREDWIAAHHWLIFHGRRVCAARKPACDACTLAPLCESFNRKGEDTK